MDAGDAVASVPSAASARGAGSAATAGGVRYRQQRYRGLRGLPPGCLAAWWHLVGCDRVVLWSCVIRLVHIEGSKLEFWLQRTPKCTPDLGGIYLVHTYKLYQITLHR